VTENPSTTGLCGSAGFGTSLQAITPGRTESRDRIFGSVTNFPSESSWVFQSIGEPTESVKNTPAFSSSNVCTASRYPGESGTFLSPHRAAHDTCGWRSMIENGWANCAVRGIDAVPPRR